MALLKIIDVKCLDCDNTKEAYVYTDTDITNISCDICNGKMIRIYTKPNPVKITGIGVYKEGFKK